MSPWQAQIRASIDDSVRRYVEREGISEQLCDESRKMHCVNQSRSRADCLAAAPLTHIVSPILILHYPVIFRAGDTFTNHPYCCRIPVLLSSSSSRDVLGRLSGLKCPPISVFFVGGVIYLYCCRLFLLDGCEGLNTRICIRIVRVYSL